LEEATNVFALENFEKNGKKAEDAIYESEKKYQTLTNPVGIYRTDVFGILLLCSRV
jgi:hypothetical protein